MQYFNVEMESVFKFITKPNDTILLACHMVLPKRLMINALAKSHMKRYFNSISVRFYMVYIGLAEQKPHSAARAHNEGLPVDSGTWLE